MKAITNLGKYLMIVMASLLIFSCSDGEDGTVGPAGQNGVDGIDGVDGTDGETGTANVIYSDWIAEGFVGGGISNPKTFNLAPSGLSAEEFNNSLILVYGRYTSIVPVVTQLPYYDDAEEDYYRALLTSANNIRVEGRSVNGLSDFEFFEDYRYIIIPGGLASGKSTVDYQNMSYEEIMEHFNIK